MCRSCGSRNFSCLAVRKCEKGREIASAILRPDKITRRRVCIRICYTNKTITSVGLIIRALHTVLRFLNRARRFAKYIFNFFRNFKRFKNDLYLYTITFCHFEESKNLSILKITNIIDVRGIILASSEMHQTLKMDEMKLFA